MNKISLNLDNYINSTLIPNIFIDQYMPSANGSYVKVYLYLLRCMQNMQSDITISIIADTLENTENDVLRAIGYWEKVGLITLGRNANGQIVSLQLNNLNAIATKENNASSSNERMQVANSTFEGTMSETSIETVQAISEENHLSPKRVYSETEITQITNDEDVKWMMNIIEVYLEHPLRPVDTQLILYLYETLHFSKELIMYLYEYCISKGKKNASYIETVALAWAKEGIDTVEKAEAHSAVYNTNYSAVSKAFGITNALGTVQQQYINTWMTKYKFSIDIIVEACNRTLLKTAKPDFKYANSILEKWFEKGVRSQKDISRLDEEHKKTTAEKLSAQTYKKQTTQPKSNNRFNAFPQREYSQEDYSNLEQKLMNLDYFAKND